MVYTINKLAKLSGISTRTLHFYDEINLLKPAYYGENNYRYYEEAQVLLLQQILFFRELGFPLNNIKKIISDPNFDKINALESHRKNLENNLHHTKQLIETINKTISHLKGETTMALENIFEGFTEEKQASYEQFLVDQGVDNNQISHVKEKIKSWGTDKWLKNKKEMDDIHQALIDAIEKNISNDSTEVQAIIKKHYEATKQFWTPNKESYIGLSQFYQSHPDFVAFYHNLHPKLLAFLIEAMTHFANRELR